MIHDTLQALGKELPLVSIIMPVYNTQDYLAICLQSVLEQTYPNFEVICVDDGSTDRSPEIIQMFMRQDVRIQMIQIENHGQGYARNLALKQAKGKYVMFVDADDYIENITLDIAVAKAENENGDFVVFDWCYYKPLGQTYNYNNVDIFFGKQALVGVDCLQLLKISSFFTVNKLYRRDFLQQNNILYAEGHLYEDISFWISAVLAVSKVSIVHSPLYRITISNTSSTKTGDDTELHYVSYVKALDECLEIVKQNECNLDEDAKYTIALYFIQKFIYYYYKRTPEYMRESFLKQFLDLFSQFDFQDQNRSNLISFGLKHNVFSDKRYFLFKQMIAVSAVYKPLIKKKKIKIKNYLKKIRNKFIRVKNKLFSIKPKPAAARQKYQTFLKQPLYEDVILFMGFDFRYTSNSRYLFEEMLKEKQHNKKIFFVTNDPLVPLQYRIVPGSERYYRFVARSKTIVFETWIPLMFKKRMGTTWIQLWHGTPLKRMMFDSNERCIFDKNPANKQSKFKDIARWDYLLVDNPNINSYFQTSFLFPAEKMLPVGYPRVKYLLSNKYNIAYKESLKNFYHIPLDKKIVLYLPTWRDYNYRQEEADFDLDYILNLKALQNMLGEEYVVIYKDHKFLSCPDNIDFENYSEAETQELLLIADYLITDYSSCIFDAFAIDLPVLLYCNDVERYEDIRGLYQSMWQNLQPYVCQSVEQIVGLLKNYVIDEHYKELKEHYAYSSNSEQNLVKFILEL